MFTHVLVSFWQAIWCGESYEEDEHGSPVKVVRSYGYATDLWSLGCVIYYALCGYSAFQMDWRVGNAEWHLADEVWAKCSRDGEWYPATVTKIVATAEGGVQLRVHWDGGENDEAEWKDPSYEGGSYEIEKKDSGGHCEGDQGEGWWDYEAMFELIGTASYTCTGPEWEQIGEDPSRRLISRLVVVHPHHRIAPAEAIPWIQSHLEEEQRRKSRDKAAGGEVRPSEATPPQQMRRGRVEDGSKEADEEDSSIDEEDEENVLYTNEARQRLRPSPRRPQGLPRRVGPGWGRARRSHGQACGVSAWAGETPSSPSGGPAGWQAEPRQTLKWSGGGSEFSRACGWEPAKAAPPCA